MASSDRPSTGDGDMVGLALGAEVLDGLHMQFDPTRPRQKKMGEGKGHAQFLQDDSVERGPLGVRLRGEWNAHPRYCVYWRDTATLKVRRRRAFFLSAGAA